MIGSNNGNNDNSGSNNHSNSNSNSHSNSDNDCDATSTCNNDRGSDQLVRYSKYLYSVLCTHYYLGTRYSLV